MVEKEPINSDDEKKEEEKVQQAKIKTNRKWNLKVKGV